jgi:C-terminal processing protease CtpA/Prc
MQIGLAALRRLDFIVDGTNGVVYFRASKEPSVPQPYDYNRLGAVFTPADVQSDELRATVLEKTPAFEAGVRNGDVLKAIDNLDTTKWRTDPNVLPLSRFWNRPVGTELHLKLSRGTNSFTTTVKLKDIVGEFAE